MANQQALSVLQSRSDSDNYAKLAAMNNPLVMEFVADYIQLCNPESVFVRTDAPADAAYIRRQALAQEEEQSLRIDGHTVHFDGPADQGWDNAAITFLVTPEISPVSANATRERQTGLTEIRALLADSMAGRQMYVLFLCLGPVNSPFSLYAVQLTDSAYVAHCEDMLYRPAYEAMKAADPATAVFRCVHSAGELMRHVSRNSDNKRMYIDIIDWMVLSVNTQNVENSLGLKNLSLLLAARKASREGWLAEHMFLMAVRGPDKRKTYFAGAFPSACGKTSTCMVAGQTVVGADIAYLRVAQQQVYAVNAERGICGSITDVNTDDDSEIWNALTRPGEVVFSNVLIRDGIPYWRGDGRAVPNSGRNFIGDWTSTKTDAAGKPVPYSHPNARYTARLATLSNCDPALDEPRGVAVAGILYGGRDADTWPPVFQSFDWEHGVITIAASVETETMPAGPGRQEGARIVAPMGNAEFLSIPWGEYISNHLRFAREVVKPPLIFGVNYFMRDKKGNYLTGKQDKRVWLTWMELRAHGQARGIETPIGIVPVLTELQPLFRQVLARGYTVQEYSEQFLIRVPEHIAKIERISALYNTMGSAAPAVLFQVLAAQRERLEKARRRYGEYINPEEFLD